VSDGEPRSVLRRDGDGDGEVGAGELLFALEQKT
jgi:hypothetical protein